MYDPDKMTRPLNQQVYLPVRPSSYLARGEDHTHASSIQAPCLQEGGSGGRAQGKGEESDILKCRLTRNLSNARIYMYTYIRIYTYIHVCVCLYIYTYMYVYIYVYITSIYIYISIYILLYVYIFFSEVHIFI